MTSEPTVNRYFVTISHTRATDDPTANLLRLTGFAVEAPTAPEAEEAALRKLLAVYPEADRIIEYETVKIGG